MIPPAPATCPPSLAWEGTVGKAAIILLAGLFVYAPVFSGGWLLDDNFELTENIAVQSPGGLALIWQGRGGADYLPIKSTVQWLLWRGFGGADSTPYHLTSIGLHLLSALLLWRLLQRLGLRHAWLGGLLLVVHPIAVESVAWVSELKNTLSLALLLPAMLAWLSFEERGRWRDYGAALVCFAAALLCKASVVMLPMVLLLYAWFRRGRVDRRDVGRSLPFVALSLATAVTTVLLQTNRSIGTEIYPLGGVASRLALAGLNVAFYLWKTVWPVGLLPMYPQWRINPPSVLQFLPWLTFAALSGWLWTRRDTGWSRATLLGLGFFVLNLGPVLGFFKMSYMRIAWASDHLAYLPSLGMIGLAAAGAGMLYDRFGERGRRVVLGLGTLVLGVLLVASHRYANVYTGMEPLCRYTLRSNPDAWLAHQLLAVANQNRGDYDAALEHATEAVRLMPGAVETQNSLGTALLMKGRPGQATPHIEEAIRLAPYIWQLHLNLAKCYRAQDLPNQTLEQYQILIQESPNTALFHSGAGACLFRLGRVDAAVEEFRQAAKLDPNLGEARQGLAIALKAHNGQGSGL